MLKNAKKPFEQFNICWSELLEQDLNDVELLAEDLLLDFDFGE